MEVTTEPKASNFSSFECKSSSCSADAEEESTERVDPRIREELERLNTSTNEINRLEKELEETQAAFQQTLKENASVLKAHGERLRKSIDQARPYYEAVQQARQVQTETQKAALKYEKSCSALKAAKEMVAITEQRLLQGTEHGALDPTWQEMMNHATMKVMEAESEKAKSEREHRDTAQAFNEMGKKVSELQRKLKSSIKKSRPYFEMKAKYQLVLESQKKKVAYLQTAIAEAKQEYSSALKNLEVISDEIHEMRRNSSLIPLEPRQDGVGAETPPENLSEHLTDGELNPGPKFSASDINIALQLSGSEEHAGNIDLKSVLEESDSVHSEKACDDSRGDVFDEGSKGEDESEQKQPVNQEDASKLDVGEKELTTAAGPSEDLAVQDSRSLYEHFKRDEENDGRLSSRSSASGATDDEEEERTS